MTEHPHRLASAPDAELARALVAAGRTLTYPDPAPDLADAVARRLRAGSGRRRLATRRVPLVAGVLLGLAAGTAAAAGLGVPGIALRSSAPSAPSVAAVRSPRTRASSGGACRCRKPACRLTSPWPCPPGLGAPEVYVADQPPGGRVSLRWDGGANLGSGLLLTQFRGELDPSFFVKGIAPADAPEPVVVAGSEGWWVEGRHEVSYRDADGRALTEVVREASSTLLWTRDGVTYRLESDLPKARAVEVGASAR